MSKIFIALYALAFVIALICTLIGYRRGLGKSAVRAIYLGILTLISFFIAKAASNAAGSALIVTLRAFYPPALIEATAANPDIELYIQSLVAVLLTPVLYMVVHIIFQLLSLIGFGAIAKRIVGLFKKELSPKTSKLTGALTGAISSLIVITALFAPITFLSSVFVSIPSEAFVAVEDATQSYGTQFAANPYGKLEHIKFEVSSAQKNTDVEKLQKAARPLAILSHRYKIADLRELSAQEELAELFTASAKALTAFNASAETNEADPLSAYLNGASAFASQTETSPLLTSVFKQSCTAIARFDAEKLTEFLEPFTPHAKLFGGILPGIFETVSNTPDSEIPEILAIFLGSPLELSVPDQESVSRYFPKNDGLLYALIDGATKPYDHEDSTIAEKGDMLIEHPELYEGIRDVTFETIKHFDINDEKNQWIFELVSDELESTLNDFDGNNEMDFAQKVQHFASQLNGSVNDYLPEEYRNTEDVSLITSHTAIKTISMFAIDKFDTDESDKQVSVLDLLDFIGVSEDEIPAWALEK